MFARPRVTRRLQTWRSGEPRPVRCELLRDRAHMMGVARRRLDQSLGDMEGTNVPLHRPARPAIHALACASGVGRQRAGEEGHDGDLLGLAQPLDRLREDSFPYREILFDSQFGKRYITSCG